MDTYVVLARLIGPDGQTDAEYVVPSPAPTYLHMAATTSPRGWWTAARDDEVAITTLTYDLTLVLGPEDGGPLAIYKRRLVQFA